MKLEWLGHASWKLKAGDKTIYIDPYQGAYDEEADLILATHSHGDHCAPSKVNAVKGEDTVVVAPVDCAAKIGSPVKSLKPGEKTSYSDIEIEAVEAYNVKRFRSPGVPFHPKGLGVGYLVRHGGKTLYHVGDSEFIPEMRDVKGVDLLLVPNGGTYTMDNEEAVEATVAIGPRKAIPMHTRESDPGEFKEKVESASDVQVVLLKPGDTFKV
jgi:L-ascorbate metabolism protein UlaG (beta-lactamase superfamily)